MADAIAAGSSPRRAFGGKTAVLHGVRDFRIEQRPAFDASSLGPHEVLLAPRAVGICGSDMHYWGSACIGGRDIPFPAVHATRFGGVMGHEAAGRVLAVGSAVTRVRVGDRVAIEAGVPCGGCSYCLGGRYNLCGEMKFLGSFLSDYSGALTATMAHDEHFVFPLPASVSFEEAAMLEPLSVGLQAVKRGKVRMGDRVLVAGAGPVGLMALLAAKAAGATRVGITDINAARLALAGRFGADATFCLPADGAAFAATGGEWDVAIECTGVGPSLGACVERVRRGGRIVLVGMGDLAVSLRQVQIKELDVVGVYRYCNTYAAALQLVASGAIDLKPMVTHHFGLDEITQAFETLRDDPTAIKIMIHPTADGELID
jgi:L-iditol 2-dehydrogenase